MEQFAAVISSVNSAGQQVQLSDLLACIKQGNEMNWAFLWLEAVGHLENRSMLELEKLVNESDSGYQLKWSELQRLAQDFEQVIELVLIGSKEEKNIHRYALDEEMRSSVDYFIEIVDNGNWEITSTDVMFADAVARLNI